MHLSLKKRLILYTIALISVTILISMVAASILIFNQTSEENQVRLNSAIDTIYRHISKDIPRFQREYDAFVNSPKITELLKKSASDGNQMELLDRLTYFPSFRNKFFKFSEIPSVMDYGIYSPAKGEQPSSLILQFVQSLKGVVLGGNRLIQTEVEGIEHLNISTIEPIRSFPPTLDIKQKHSIIQYEGQDVLLTNNTVQQENDVIAYLSIRRSLNLNLNLLDLDLGVNINLYDHSGNMIRGHLKLPDLKVLTLSEFNQIITLSDAKEFKYDSVIAPIDHKNEILGYISVSISQNTTTDKIIQAILLLAAIGIIIVLLAIGVALFLITNITRPITELTEATETIASGDLELMIDTSRQDELGALAHSFEDMRNSVIEKNKVIESEVRALRDEVEKRKQAEDAEKLISKENEQLYQQAQRLIERLKEIDHLKDEFLANTSHELRTPLMGIIGLSESLLGGTGGTLTEEQANNIGMVVQSGYRLSRLINDILDYSQLKYQEMALNIQSVNLIRVTDLVLQVCQPLIGVKNLKLFHDFPANLPAVSADENRLQQILFNLVGNAIKYTAQGNIQISAEIEKDQWLRITVKDTGVGIAKDQLGAIFNVFEQGKSGTQLELGGTGLGLALTKKLVELHMGEIGVSSQLGQGSTFSFTLPINKNTPQSLSEPMPVPVFSTQPDKLLVLPDRAPDESSAHILIVDDDPIILQVLINQLTEEKYQISTATNGIEALAKASRDSSIDLILLDVMMPEMNGYEVCQELRLTFSMQDLPIVLLTARNQSKDIVKGLRMGANEHLSKPINRDELLARIQTQLDAKNLYLHLKENELLKKEIQKREKVEKELAASRLGLIHILDLSEELIISCNTSHEITFFNQKASEFLGYSINDITGEALSLIIPEWSELPEKAVTQHLKIVKKDQKVIELDASIAPFNLKQSKGFVISILTDSEMIKGSISQHNSNRISHLESRLTGLMETLQQGKINFLEDVPHSESFQSSNNTDLLSFETDDISQVCVDLMNLSLKNWFQATSKSRRELAEESQIWSVTIDNRGSFRTQTLDRYLKIKSLPKNPNYRKVIRTAYFVLRTCPNTEITSKDELESKLNQLESLMEKVG
ncbi:MAG: response regulator [Proteobacteria bacterium]|nr:response regulator [Pseudomonadota bacterium]